MDQEDNKNETALTYKKLGPVRIVILDQLNAEIVEAVRYVAREDGSEAIIYKKLAQGFMLPNSARMDPGFVRDPVTMTDMIDQPMAAAPGDDPATARVYSKIRGETDGEYEYYRCAHGSPTKQEGEGVHFAKNAADVKDCRQALENAGLLYSWS